jgi:4-amino-4-deoxy-L-arabinose transferase-like glycosyltransferase
MILLAFGAGFSRSRVLIYGFLVCLPTAISAVLVFWNLKSLGLSHWDEYNYVITAIWFAGRKDGVFTIYEPPGFPFSVGLLFKLFGVQDYIAIATSGLYAVMTVVLVTFIGAKFFDLKVGIVASILLTVSPLFIAYSRMALTDVAFTFFFTASVFSMYIALRSGRLYHLISAGVLFAACNTMKYNGVMALLVPILYMPVLLRGTKKSEVLRNGYRHLKFLVILCLPTLVFGVLFLFLLGVGGSIRDLASFRLLHIMTLDTLAKGFAKFQAGALLPHGVQSGGGGQLAVRPLGEAVYYLQVMFYYVPLPILLLAIVGLATKKLEDNPHLFTVFWAVLSFVEISSISARYSRALLPVLPPLAILAAVGITRLQSIWHFEPKRPRLKSLFRGAILALLLALVFGTSLIPLIQTVDVSHNAYRETGQILQKVAGNSTVLAETQPVIAIYYRTKFGDLTDANLAHANFLVVDFIGAERYRLTIQLLEKQGRLKQVTSIHNDALDLVYLDSRSIDRLKTWNYYDIVIYRVENATRQGTQ